MADERFQVVIGAVDEASRILQQVKGEMEGIGIATQTAQRTMSQAFGDMQRAGVTMSAAITAPIVGIATAATKTSIDFESAFAGVRKTVDATEEEFAQLEQGILDMSKELPASANEIAKVGEAAGQLGIATESILTFTRTMIDLGESTNLSADQAATALARFANIVQMPQDQFDRLGSTIVELGNNLATTESEIVEMGLRLAGAGKQVGMTEAEIMALAGALSSVGIEAQMGGSAISRLMVDMQLAVETGNEQLSQFADVSEITAEGFKKAFQEDAVNAILAFIEGLNKAEENGASAIKVLDDMGITEIRLRDALLRLAGASDVAREAVTLGTEAWEENTALSEEAGKRYETTASQIKMMKNQIIEIGITLGETLLPIIKDTFIPLLEKLAGHLSGLIDWFNNLSPIAKDFFLAFGAAAAVGGPVLLMVGSIGKAVESFKVLGKLFSGAGILSPTGLVIAGVAIVAIEVIKHWDEISAFLTKCWEGIKSTATAVWGEIKDFVSHIWDGVEGIFSGAWDKITNTLEKSWNWVKDTANNLWGSIKGIFGKEMEETNKIVEEGTKAQEGAWQSLSNNLVGHSIIPEMCDAINSALGTIDFTGVEANLDSLELKFQETATGVVTSTQEATNSINDFIGVISEIGDVVIGVQFGEKPTAGQIGGIFGGILNLFSGIPSWIGGIVDMIFGWIDQIQTRTKQMIDELAGQFESVFTDFFTAPTLGEAIQNFGQNLHSVVYNMMLDALVQAILASEVMQDALKKLGQAINKYMKDGSLEGLMAAAMEFEAFMSGQVLPIIAEIYPVFQPFAPTSGQTATTQTFGGSIPSYQAGGYVPKTGLALLHAGEYVSPKGASIGNVEINVNTTGGVDGSDLWDEFEREARRRGVVFA